MLRWSVLTVITALTLCMIMTTHAQVAPVGGPNSQPLPPAELQAKSTNQIVGDIRGIYMRPFPEDGGVTVAYIAEIEVKQVIKGDHTKPGMVVYLSFWARTPTALRKNPALDPGYSISPRMTGTVQCYYTVNEDGVCEVVSPNGMERFVEPAKTTD